MLLKVQFFVVVDQGGESGKSITAWNRDSPKTEQKGLCERLCLWCQHSLCWPCESLCSWCHSLPCWPSAGQCNDHGHNDGETATTKQQGTGHLRWRPLRWFSTPRSADDEDGAEAGSSGNRYLELTNVETDNISKKRDPVAQAKTTNVTKQQGAKSHQLQPFSWCSTPHIDVDEDGLEADSEVDTWKRLALGEVLQKAEMKLRYTFYDFQSYSKSPVVGWYSSHHCLNLQTNCARKILSSKTLDISIAELHAGIAFKAVRRELPQSGSRVFVSGTGWPDITGGTVLMTPCIQDSDIVMLLHQCVMVSLCDCLILTVKDVDRQQLQSLLKLLIMAKRNCTTVIIFHYVEDEEDFKVCNNGQQLD